MFELAWEGRLVIIVGLLTVFGVLVVLRTYTLRKAIYKWNSPRGVSTICICGVFVLASIYTIITLYYYEETFPIRTQFDDQIRKLNKQDMEDREMANLIVDVANKRTTLAFFARVMTVTMLWLAKTSFITVYLESRQSMSRNARWAVYISGAALVATYSIVWLSTGIKAGNEWLSSDFKLKHQYVLKWGLNSDGILNLLLFDTYLDGLFWWEALIGILNVITDILLVITAYVVFSSITTPWHALRAEIPLLTLCFITVSLACSRLSVIIAIQSLWENTLNYIHHELLASKHLHCSPKMEGDLEQVCRMVMTNVINATIKANSVLRPLRVAATMMTEIEALIAGCIVCLPALRVFFRESRGIYPRQSAFAEEEQGPLSKFEWDEQAIFTNNEKFADENGYPDFSKKEPRIPEPSHSRSSSGIVAHNGILWI